MNWKWSILGAVAGLIVGSSRAVARPPAVDVVNESKAVVQVTEVVLTPGRQSLIEFRNGERIQFISLADVSQIVYLTNMPVETGRASLIVLKTIEPLRLKGVVEVPSLGRISEDSPYETAYPTNLVVSTIDSTGELRTYTFDLRVSVRRVLTASNGIAIISDIEPLKEEVLVLEDGRRAILSDIELGYVEALREKYTSYKDPVVGKIQKFLNLARYDVSFVEAARRAELPFVIVEKLAEIGLNSTVIPSGNNPQQATEEQRPSLLRGLTLPMRKKY